MHSHIDKTIDHLFRNTYGKVVAYLTSRFGGAFLDHAEDIAQEALIAAYQNWSYHGLPDKPEAWVFAVAKNKALNVLRQAQRQTDLQKQMHIADVADTIDSVHFADEMEDSMLRMIFACCHPDLSPAHQLVLVLSTLGGFSRKEIAHCLLSPEERVKKQLFRAKKKIREEGLALDVPSGPARTRRLGAVLTCLYLLFNEGYNSKHKNELIRKDLCLEAMRLTQILLRRFENDKRVPALYALMCFHAARFDSRIDDRGAIILFQDQDRSKWNQALINYGKHYMVMSVGAEKLSAYHIEAQIASLHCCAQDYEHTDWKMIYELYSLLYNIKPSPVILLNQAIILSKLQSFRSAIAALEKLREQAPELSRYYLFDATLGEFYKQIGKTEQAIHHLQLARAHTASEKERDLLSDKIAALPSTY